MTPGDEARAAERRAHLEDEFRRQIVLILRAMRDRGTTRGGADDCLEKCAATAVSKVPPQRREASYLNLRRIHAEALAEVYGPDTPGIILS